MWPVLISVSFLFLHSLDSMMPPPITFSFFLISECNRSYNQHIWLLTVLDFFYKSFWQIEDVLQCLFDISLPSDLFAFVSTQVGSLRSVQHRCNLLNNFIFLYFSCVAELLIFVSTDSIFCWVQNVRYFLHLAFIWNSALPLRSLCPSRPALPPDGLCQLQRGWVLWKINQSPVFLRFLVVNHFGGRKHEGVQRAVRLLLSNCRTVHRLSDIPCLYFFKKVNLLRVRL